MIQEAFTSTEQKNLFLHISKTCKAWMNEGPYSTSYLGI